MDDEAKSTEPAKRKSILELDSSEARSHFLKHESYCSLDLPPYIVFKGLIDDVSQELEGKSLEKLSCKKLSPREFDNVNYIILHNKDGKYSWRPFELIHPALYVSLVSKITGEWEHILDRFKQFTRNDRLACLSLPVQSKTIEKDKAEQVNEWWQKTEQRSIELSLDYEYLIQTDITDCYGAIYTHSIAWALHTKSEAKKKRRDLNLIGNVIDSRIQDMRNGQTNGIPQGSVLMDFIAEMVLGYADLEISEHLCEAGIVDDYHILRYRDDYRIFVNSPQLGETIVKLITETTTQLGLKLNMAKTQMSNDVVKASIKTDKFAWIARKQADKDLQKYLLNIYDFALAYPGSGSVIRSLDEFHKRISIRSKPIKDPKPLIAVVANVAYRNPRSYAVCAAILSKLLSSIESDEEKLDVIQRIRQKFNQIPNTGQMQIWLQRITYPLNGSIEYDESLCKLVAGNTPSLWNNDWISSIELKQAIDPTKIIDVAIRDEMLPVITPQEVELFHSSSSNWFYG